MQSFAVHHTAKRLLQQAVKKILKFHIYAKHTIFLNMLFVKNGLQKCRWGALYFLQGTFPFLLENNENMLRSQ